MRRLLVFCAAALVLAANGWGVWHAARNRTQPIGGTLQLTERELPLQPVALESSVTALRLNWKNDSGDSSPRGSASWLNTNKLAELGFDCSLPLDRPEARHHYDAMPARRVFLALQLNPDTSGEPDKPARLTTGLVVVDAALNPQQLRERYFDPQKYIICRGFIRLTVRRHDRDGAPLSAPQVEPWIDAVCPAEVSVPKPVNRPLLALRQTVPEKHEKPAAQPRFSVRIHWGRNYEPWVDDIRTEFK